MLKNESAYFQKLASFDKLLSDFLSFLEYIFCARCWYERQGKFDKSRWHTKGSMLYLLANSKKIDSKSFCEWKSQHLSAGLIQALQAYMEIQQKKNLFDCVGQIYDGKCYENSDMEVERIFYSCLFGAMDNEVVADHHFELPKSVVKLISKIVPSHDKLWISHLSEHGFLNMSETIHASFYPQYFCEAIDPKFWTPKMDGQKMNRVEDTARCFACHVDTLRQDSCHWHIFNFLKKHNGWKTLMGLMTKDDFLATGNEICVAPASMTGRDHPYGRINCQIPKNQWIFLYHDEHDLDLVGKQVDQMISFSCIKKFVSVLSLILIKCETFKVV